MTGNTSVDVTLLYAARAITRSQVHERFGLPPGNYLLLTCHRPSNTDDLSSFTWLMSAKPLESGGACLVQDISPEALCRLAAEM